MNMKKKVVWLSANVLGYELLKEAKKCLDIDISAIITLSDESETVMYDSIAKERWEEFSVPTFEIIHINNEKSLIEKINPDLIIMCGWRQIISDEILSIPKMGIVGFHPSLLPMGRGPAPLINSILEGFSESGLSMYYISNGIDDGDIIGQEKFQIMSDDYASDLYEKCITVGKKLISKYLIQLVNGNAPRIQQDKNKVTYFKKRGIMDNEIFLERDSPEVIYRKIRAFSKPYLGAFIRIEKKKIVIWKADLFPA